MVEIELHLEQRALEPGRPIVIWPGRRALYAAYDSGQISESRAVAAIRLLASGAPGAPRVTRAGDGHKESQPRILQSMVARDDQETAG